MGILSENIEGGVNFADVQAPSFDPVPAGWYHCAITNTEQRFSGADSKKYPNCPMANIEFTVQEGDHEGRRFWRNYLIHSDFLGYLKQLLLATGKWTQEEIDDEDFDFDYEDLEDSELLVKVNRKKSNYSGEYENNVTGVKALSEGAPSTKSDSLMP